MCTEKFNFHEMAEENRYQTTAYLLSVTSKEDKNGKIYLLLRLNDGKNTVVAKMFETTLTDLNEKGVRVKTVVDLNVYVKNFNGYKTYIINSIEPNTSTDVNISDFARKIKNNRERLFDSTLDLLTPYISLEKDSIANLTRKILIDNKEAFIRSAGGQSAHHDMLGGLLLHSYCVAVLAEVISPVYMLDFELFVCGALLHDIGKIKSLNTDDLGNSTPTLGGKSLGHEYLGAEIVEMAYAASGLDIPEERMNALKYMVLNHHFHNTDKSDRTNIPELQMLHFADMMDAYYDYYDNNFNERIVSNYLIKTIFDETA